MPEVLSPQPQFRILQHKTDTGSDYFTVQSWVPPCKHYYLDVEPIEKPGYWNTWQQGTFLSLKMAKEAIDAHKFNLTQHVVYEE